MHSCLTRPSCTLHPTPARPYTAHPPPAPTSHTGPAWPVPPHDMIPKGAFLKVVDNSGAKLAQVIGTYGHTPGWSVVGDVVKVAVKEARGEKVAKGTLKKAVVVETKWVPHPQAGTAGGGSIRHAGTPAYLPAGGGGQPAGLLGGRTTRAWACISAPSCATTFQCPRAATLPGDAFGWS